MYFDTRVEPQFMILLNGGEFKRIIGYNFDRLHGFLDKTTECHLRDFNYIGNTQNQWERFYDDFDRYQRCGEYDRDPLRAHVESENDQWRGVGTDHP